MTDTNEDLRTRVALLERSVVTRDQLADREDRMLERLEKMLGKFEGRMEDALSHGLKVYGHETSDQLQKLRQKINDEQDAKLAGKLSEVAQQAEQAKPSQKSDFLQRWGLPIGLAAVVGGPGTAVQVMNLINAVL